MRECDKRNSHISSKLHVICILCDNDIHIVTKTFTPLHYTCRHFYFSPFKLHPTKPVCTSLTTHLPSALLHFPTVPFHFTSLHFTALLTIFGTLLFLSLHPVCNFFPNSLFKNRIIIIISIIIIILYLFSSVSYQVAVVC